MRRLFLVSALVFALCVPSFALSDSEYLRMKKASAAFAEADEFLSDAYSNLKNVLPRSEFANIREEQREWLRTGRDEDARSYMDDGYSKTEAYTKATNDRAEMLYHMFQMYKLERGE